MANKVRHPEIAGFVIPDLGTVTGRSMDRKEHPLVGMRRMLAECYVSLLGCEPDEAMGRAEPSIGCLAALPSCPGCLANGFQAGLYSGMAAALTAVERRGNPAKVYEMAAELRRLRRTFDTLAKDYAGDPLGRVFGRVVDRIDAVLEG